MRTVENLAEAITLAGVVCLSIRAPNNDGMWIANARVDDTGWKCGKPSESLEQAILSVLWVANEQSVETVRSPAPADKWQETTHMQPVEDDLEDLLG